MLPIYSIASPELLKSISREVKPDELGQQLEEHMLEMAKVMYAHKGVGLAGVQIGDTRRILVADVGTNVGESTIYMVNPTILESSGETSIEEGCLSLPGFTLTTTRADKIKVRYLTPLGLEKEESFEGYQASILQHECDHLEGRTLLDRASHLKRSRYMTKVKKYTKDIQKSVKQIKKSRSDTGASNAVG